MTLVCLAYLDLSPPIHRGYVRLHDLRLRLTCIVIHIIYFRKCVDSGRLTAGRNVGSAERRS